MGWFDGASDLGGGHHRSHSSSRHHSHSSPRGSGIFGSGDHKHNSSRSSFFGFNNHRSSSYYKRSPRQGYVNRIYSKLRRLLRDLIYYMKRHPMKVFMLVIMPLITGGALTGLLAKFGIRLPHGLEKMFGAGRGGGMGVGRGYDGGMQWERPTASGPLGGLGPAIGGLGGIGGAVSLAKMFM